MKKLLFAVLVSSISLVAFAEGTQPKHIISVGTDGFGWSGLAQVFDWDKDVSGVKKHEASESELELNYSYVFPNRVMLGALISVEASESEVKDTAGDKTKNEESGTELGISIGYNFNEDIYNSWWIQGILASGKFNDTTKDSSGKEELDYGYSAFYIKAGKRINLDSWGLKNISYNPTISVTTAKISGDAEDAGLEEISQFNLEIIKFDIVF